MLNRKPLALYLAALFVFCVSGCSKRDNDSSGDSGDSAIVECISLDNFSDKAFGEYAISRWDLDGDKCISQSEASKITEIPKQAFKNNNIIESIDDLNLFPSITTLREEAFAGCIKIKTANLKYIQIVEQYTFSGTTYLPNVETVLSHAFEGTSLESVSLPKATYVGECAFVGVSTLKTLDLPNVETVGEYAFFGTSLESVSLPKATYVGDHAFCDVSTLKTLDLPNVETVDGWAFSGTSLEIVSLPVETVDGWALSGTSLESVSLPKATNVGDGAFKDVSSLTSVDLPSVETVGDCAFGFTSLESVSLPKATYVGDGAFCDVSTLKTLDLPNVETVDSMAFGRTALESVSLPKATYVGDGAFYSVSTLKTLDLPMATNIGAEIVVVYNDYSDKYELLLDTLYLTSPLPISMSSSSHDIEGYHNTNLYLNINKKSEVSGVSWNGIEWKSITFVE